MLAICFYITSSLQYGIKEMMSLSSDFPNLYGKPSMDKLFGIGRFSMYAFTIRFVKTRSSAEHIWKFTELHISGRIVLVRDVVDNC